MEIVYYADNPHPHANRGNFVKVGRGLLAPKTRKSEVLGKKL